jgi:peptide-methionine (R)-S-oxide reductase
MKNPVVLILGLAFIGFFATLLGTGCLAKPEVEPLPPELPALTPNADDKVVLTEEEWKERLSPMQFRVLREHGTERSFSGALLENKKEGTYLCGGCGLPLFPSSTKFDSGTGWPSFWDPVNDTNVGRESDLSHGMTRTEVHCSRCQGHLGHVFTDGPEPTGLRYCINSVSLQFEPAEK